MMLTKGSMEHSATVSVQCVCRECMLMSGGVNVESWAEARSPGRQSMSRFGFYLESGGGGALKSFQ